MQCLKFFLASAMAWYFSTNKSPILVSSNSSTPCFTYWLKTKFKKFLLFLDRNYTNEIFALSARVALSKMSEWNAMYARTSYKSLFSAFPVFLNSVNCCLAKPFSVSSSNSFFLVSVFAPNSFLIHLHFKKLGQCSANRERKNSSAEIGLPSGLQNEVINHVLKYPHLTISQFHFIILRRLSSQRHNM